MVLRRVISILVLVGVLAHAGAVARHLVVMAEHLTETAIVAQLVDQGVICHTDSDAADASASGAAQGAVPDKVKQSCPICEGLASLFVLDPPLAPVLARIRPVGVYDHPTDQRVALLKRIRPQGRGPPSLA